jgi:hypothetical protein
MTNNNNDMWRHTRSKVKLEDPENINVLEIMV